MLDDIQLGQGGIIKHLAELEEATRCGTSMPVGSPDPAR